MNDTIVRKRELMKQDLLSEEADILSEDSGNVLGFVVRRLFPNLVRCFVLYWLPEQAEEICWLLVSRTEIAKIEIPRDKNGGKNASLLEMVSVESYKHRRLSRESRRRLEIALELI